MKERLFVNRGITRIGISLLLAISMLLAPLAPIFQNSVGQAMERPKQARTKSASKVKAASSITNNKSTKQKDKEIIIDKVSKTGTAFIKNEGQIENQSVKYYINTFVGNVFIDNDGELTYLLLKRKDKKKDKAANEQSDVKDEDKDAEPEAVEGWALKERLIGAKDIDPKGIDKAKTKINYLIGNKESWKTGLAAYNHIELGEVYSGIDLNLRAHENNFEKVFVVQPGAEVKDIQVSIEGASSLAVNNKGELEVKTGLGDISFTKPIAYQEKDGIRHYVRVTYLVDQSTYGFDIGNYDKTQPLIIDPMLASTTLGSGGYNYGRSIVKDSAGNIYVTGTADSRANFPTTPGAYDIAHNGGYDDAFISKLDSNLNLVSSTFLGGSSYDRAYSLAVDSSGNICVVGQTYSSNFPTTSGVYDTSHNGNWDAFISVLDSSLSNLLYSTFLGGSNEDKARSVCRDGDGNIYVVGETKSSGFPTTSGAYDTSQNGTDYTDIFVSKINSSLTSLLTSTFVGSSRDDYVNSVIIDPFGNVCFAGESYGSYPITPGAFKSTSRGYSDAIVSKLNPSLTSLLASTYIGGYTVGINDWDRAKLIVADSEGNYYIAGLTYSSDFPTTEGAYDRTFNGSPDAFVLEFNSDLSNLLCSTFIGGATTDDAYALIKSSSGDIFVGGSTQSSDFPTTEGAYDRTFNGASDIFISRLNANLSSLLASTYIGGSGNDDAMAMVGDNQGNIYVTGYTGSVFVYKMTGDLSKTNKPVASFTYSPSNPEPLTSVNFDASASHDSDGQIVSYQWDFGDNTTGNGVSPGHSYSATGIYHVVLTVTDNDGASSSFSQDLYVNPKECQPAWTNPNPDPLDNGPKSTQRPILILIAGLYSNASNESGKGDIWEWLRTNADEILPDVDTVYIAPTQKGANSSIVIDSLGHLSTNAERLANYIQQIKSFIQGHPVILVGHSMGGIVARGFIDDPKLVEKAGIGKELAGLIQIGSPNKGSNLSVVANNIRLLSWYYECDATHDLSPIQMWIWNKFHTNPKGVTIYQHGGNYLPDNPGGYYLSPYEQIVGVLLSGAFLGEPNDGAVSFSSLEGPSSLKGIRLTTPYNYRHSLSAPGRQVPVLVPQGIQGIPEDGLDSVLLYFLRDQINELTSNWDISSQGSQSMQMSIAAYIMGMATFTMSSSSSNEATPGSPFLPTHNLIVPAGSNAVDNIRIGEKTIISLTSTEGTPTVSISDSGGPLVINPVSIANSDGTIQTLAEVMPTNPGLHSVTVALEGGAGGNVTLSGVAESGPCVTLSADDVNYLAGDEVTVTATIESSSSPVQGATVSVVANYSGGQSNITLADNGVSPDATANDGIYTGKLLLMGPTGDWILSATAIGDTFERAASAVLSVGSSSWASFSGSLAETTTPGTGSTLASWGL
ncbi:MAG: SBBP repeat-containing protein, partial [Actinomycetota bacterium]|nr:SBBP repeat-containing protein [Actinomycetota bacterium]